MQANKIYDLIGIGIGPFNLGLAALLQDHPTISYLFLEQRESFDWHPGLLLPWVRLQVPYFADLVTLANPKSAYSYINYLHIHQRLFRFGAHENIFPLRTEYNRYCKWVAAQLPGLLFSHRCEQITYEPAGKFYTVRYVDPVTKATGIYQAKHLVIGTGTQPAIPENIPPGKYPGLIHSADYLPHKHTLLSGGDITLVGSGQSAAEIFYDLLQYEDLLHGLHWFTRSRQIVPMDYSRFALEMATPDYLDYFFSLPEPSKREVLATQAYLYKGINQQLITAIHDQLYLLDSADSKLKPKIHPASELMAVWRAGKALTLSFRHRDTDKRFTHTTSALILATGYHYSIPPFLEPIRERIDWTADGNYQVQKEYAVDRGQTIFVQNADLHTHGFNSADLGMGTYRNMIMLNCLLQREHYTIERGTAFQSFGLEPT